MFQKRSFRATGLAEKTQHPAARRIQMRGRSGAGRAKTTKGKSRKGKPTKGKYRDGISGGFSTTVDRAYAGQEDTEWTTMVFETTSAFTSTAGASSFLQIKGNSIFHPYPSVASSPAGYQRMYTQYAVAQVESSTCEVTVWSGVSGQDEPFRIIVIPCLAADYTVYSGYSNVAALASVPHAVQGVFSPGGKMPRVTGKGSNATMLYGERVENVSAESVANDYTQQSGGDPGFLWYFLVGYQNFAGTTTTNQQAQVKLTYRVKWSRPIATAEQNVDGDFFGNEKITPAVVERLRALAAPRAIPMIERKQPLVVQAETKFSVTDIKISDATSVGDTKASQGLKLTTQKSAFAGRRERPVVAGVVSLLETQQSNDLRPRFVASKPPVGYDSSEWDSEFGDPDQHDHDDDQDEAEFIQYMRMKMRARSAMRQADAFENADFSATGRVATAKAMSLQ